MREVVGTRTTEVVTTIRHYGHYDRHTIVTYFYAFGMFFCTL